ncbi:hypothetical protein [Mycobacterium sp. PSTR-4-N]|uniref:hypothetical protein n=1 Tax=Mycobacterium sp. PSTR-4-N TaxID=2917745 RepID=UPI001F155180|nr:hypothetical protein [Mycobacterium sp. PSTR-4-N]MCG7596726.1 hypothetical protein [Mycobacterium sp. PSTR-4-N]
MGAVLGLSLTSTEVTWALVDEAERTVIDHDSLELDGGSETGTDIDTDIARLAARGGHGLARACGLDVDRLRLVWTPDAETRGRRLRTDLRSLGVTVDAVPLVCATRVLIDPQDCDIPPLVALAYGAALAEVDPAEAITVALPRVATRRKRPVRVLAAAIGVAAAAAVGAVFLTAGSVPEVEPAASAAAAPAAAEPGWVSVTAPVDAAAEPALKFVTAPSPTYAAAPVRVAAPAAPAAPRALAAPAPAVVAAPEALPGPGALPGPDALPAPNALPGPAPVASPEGPEAPEAIATSGTPTAPSSAPHLPVDDQQHLPGAEPLVAPLPGPDTEAPALPDTEMTVPVNVFTALP